MHIQILFKKKPEFKDFPLLINASDNRYCLSGFVLPSGRALWLTGSVSGTGCALFILKFYKRSFAKFTAAKVNRIYLAIFDLFL